jgi:hypothetical protein
MVICHHGNIDSKISADNPTRGAHAFAEYQRPTTAAISGVIGRVPARGPD